MIPRTPTASAARTRQKAPRAPKVRARDFLIEMPRFGVPASSAKAHRIWEKSPLGKKAASDVPVDGNGNVRALVQANAANPSVSGIVERYAYDGFGRELAGNTPAASSVNTFRFSTKQADPETDMNYYGYRYYDSNNGRWINRDPIAEQGGLNLYGMVKNNTLIAIDLNGLTAIGPIYPGPTPVPTLPSIADIVRSFLHTDEERAAWDRYAAGTGQDYQLTTAEMDSVLAASPGFYDKIKKLAGDCKGASSGWKRIKLSTLVMKLAVLGF